MLECRWWLPSRNGTPCGSPGDTCDLHRQTQLLVWDLDWQLPVDDPVRRLPNVVVDDFALRQQ